MPRVTQEPQERVLTGPRLVARRHRRQGLFEELALDVDQAHRFQDLGCIDCVGQGMVFQFPLGRISDRMDRRKLVVFADIGRGVLVPSLALVDSLPVLVGLTLECNATPATT